jgi:hypothetical protein
MPQKNSKKEKRKKGAYLPHLAAIWQMYVAFNISFLSAPWLRRSRRPSKSRKALAACRLPAWPKRLRCRVSCVVCRSSCALLSQRIFELQ